MAKRQRTLSTDFRRFSVPYDNRPCQSIFWLRVKLVSYRLGDHLCLSLCEKSRRQPYVTYVAYVLMSPAVSGTRANNPFF